MNWLFLMALFAGLPSHAGWDHGNAGDTYVTEFTLTARDLLVRLKLLPSSELREVNLTRLAGAIASVKVSSEEKVVLRGREVDAMNDPELGIIVVSRSRWRTLRTAPETTNRLTLVLHEYLFHIGVDDTNFRLSGSLIPQMQIKDFNPNRWWNPLNPSNRLTTNLIYNNGDCSIAALEFDTQATEEAKEVVTEGDCESFAKVLVRKLSFQAPPSSQARGIFHRYEIQVSGREGQNLGALTYEPEWGRCLLPEDGACAQSGRLFVGPVELRFWMQR